MKRLGDVAGSGESKFIDPTGVYSEYVKVRNILSVLNASGIKILQ
jgi:hypothetical protein